MPVRSLITASALLLTATSLANYDEPLRPLVHFSPARNFMNDPNGLVFYKGEYHLFYQHNPFGDRWGHMSWGHAVSRDLLHWEHLPVALREENGIMIFSGSAVVDSKNTSGLCRPEGDDPSCLVAIYTGHTETRQHQNLAYSRDRGRTWTKHAGNPVLDIGLKDFRDPKVFWHAPTARWVMVVVLPDQHKVRFYGSRDLKAWERLSDFGPAGATGGVWECPDLFELPVDGSPNETRWVLDVDINPGARWGGSGGQYFVGTFDGTRFVNDNPSTMTLWVDQGKDFYATISYSDIPPADGRRIWMGWMSNWLYANETPTSPWRGVQSIPRVLGLTRTNQGLRLTQAPIAELAMLRATPSPETFSTVRSLPKAAEIEVEITRDGWREAGLRFFNLAGEEVRLGIANDGPELFVDRRQSRKTPFHDEYAGRHGGPVRWMGDTLALRIIWDQSTIEIFSSDGTVVLSERVFPTAPLDRVEPFTSGRGAGVAAARLWALVPVWN